MTFLHKLAQRLARLRGILAVGILVAACEPPVAPDTLSSAARLLVSPRSADLLSGQIADFSVVGLTVAGDTLTGVAVNWTASGGTVVDTSTIGGRHHLHWRAGPGHYRVLANARGSAAADTASITVNQVPVASVAVTPSVTSVVAGQTIQLTATPNDSTGAPLTGRTITWGSSNPAAATVNGSGVVTGVGAGTATITATSETKSGTASVTVTSAVVAVAAVSVSPSPVSVTVGQTAQLTATPQDANGNPLTGRVVTWGSSNAAAATVSGSGLVTAVAAGGVTITATSETKSGTASVTVTNIAVATVSVSPATASVPAGQTVQLTATPRDANGNPLTGRVVTWGSGTPAVATVSGSGLVRGVAAGAATITATSEGQSGTAALTVTPAPVATVSVSPATATVNAGQTVQLAVTLKDANGNTLTGRVVTWGSSTPAVATVSGSGLVTGVAAGAATITATSEGQSGTAALTVRVPVAAVSVTPAAASLTTGQTVQLVATPKDASGNALTGRVVTWGSSNTAVATVNGSGLVTAVVAGTATITATSEGQSGTASVTVTLAPVATVSVSPAAPSVTVGQAVQLTVTLKDANGITLTGRVVTWGSSNPAVATVSGSGLVTAVAAGAATLTATSETKTGTATVTVVTASNVWTNEPAGLSGRADKAGDRDYDFHLEDVNGTNPTTSGWFNPYPTDFTQTGQLNLVSDATAPSPTSVVQVMYPIGWNKGSAPGEVDLEFSPVTEFYVGFYFKISNPYLGVSGGHNKIAYVYTGNKDLVFEFHPVTSSGNGNSSSGPWAFFFAEYVSQNGAEADTYGTTQITSGVWYKVEILMSYSGSVIKWWVNGAPDGTIPANFSANAGGPIHLVQFSPTYGGGGAPTKTEVDYVWYDHVHVSGKP